MDIQSDPRRAWIPWAAVSLMLVAVAVVAYTIGAQREAVQVAGEPARVVYRHGPWGFLWVFALLWFVGGLRWLVWGPFGGRWRYRHYYHPGYDEPRDQWEAWHRREHERMQHTGNGEPHRAPENRDSR